MSAHIPFHKEVLGLSLYSYQYKFVFIHIPKNAGSTFISNYSAVLPVGELLHFEHLNMHLGYERDPALGNHFTYQMIADLVDKHAIGIDLNAYHKFCVVRNPWERMVSLYEHRLRKIDRLTNGVPRNTAEDKALLHRGFEAWLLNTQNVSDRVLVRMPQLDWIRDKEGRVVADKIISIQGYDQQILEVVDHVGLPKIELPRQNSSSKDSSRYREYYSQATQAFVAENFQEDIEMFGFSF